MPYKNKEERRAYNKAYREANKEEIAAQRKAYREANREAVLARQKAHYEANKEKIAARQKAHREANKEKIAAQQKAYNQTPAGKLSSYKRGAKQRGHEFRLTREQFESFWQKPCTYCGTDIETIGLDRMDSSKGYTMENVTPCCFGCNARKGDMLLSEWNEWLARIAGHETTREEELFIKHHEKELNNES